MADLMMATASDCDRLFECELTTEDDNPTSASSRTAKMNRRKQIKPSRVVADSQSMISYCKESAIKDCSQKLCCSIGRWSAPTSPSIIDRSHHQDTELHHQQPTQRRCRSQNSCVMDTTTPNLTINLRSNHSYPVDQAGAMPNQQLLRISSTITDNGSRNQLDSTPKCSKRPCEQPNSLKHEKSTNNLFGETNERDHEALDLTVCNSPRKIRKQQSPYEGPACDIGDANLPAKSSPYLLPTELDTKLGSSADGFSCSLCGSVFTNSYLFICHLETAHGIVYAKHSGNSTDDGSALNETSDVVNTLSDDPSCNSHHQANLEVAATIAATTRTNSASGGGGSTSKNNQDHAGHDDYCEVCQKHFCNKYYLRKHKADVHGIYTDYVRPTKPATTSPADPGQDPIKTPNRRSPGPTICTTAPPSTSPSPGVFMPQMQNSLGSNGMMTNPYFGTLLYPPQLFDGRQNTGNMINNFHNLETSTTSPLFNPGGPGYPRIDGSNLNPYDHTRQESTVSCDVCEKEFCNEEYLRLHRHTRHGENESIHCGPNDFCDRDGAEAIEGRSKQDNTLDDHCPKFAGSVDSYGNSDGCERDGGEKNDAHPLNMCLFDERRVTNTGCKPEPNNSCSICERDFNNIIALREHFMSCHSPHKDSITKSGGKDYGLFNVNCDINQHQLHQESSTGRNDTKAGSGLSEGQAGYSQQTNSPTKLSERVVCDICNKQVCNKYFLKTHKTRVHGILPDKVAEESKAVASKIHVHQSPPVEVSPVNYSSDIMDLTDSSPSNPMTDQERSELIKNSIDPEAYCLICKKEFCSKYFLRTHQQNIHKIKQPPSIPSPKKPKVVAKDPSKPKTASPAQTRVTCSICNKELCNKYFLRSHMMNVHNMISEESKREVLDENGYRASIIGNIPSTFGSSSIPFGCSATASFGGSYVPIIKHERMDVMDIADLSASVSAVASSSLPAFVSTHTNHTSHHDNQHHQQPQPHQQQMYTNSMMHTSAKCSICDKVFHNQNECNEHSLKVHGYQNAGTKRPSNSDNQAVTNEQMEPGKPKELRLESSSFRGMQPFIVESDDSKFFDHFVPCMVYLPIKSRLQNTVSFNLRLKPVTQEGLFVQRS